MVKFFFALVLIPLCFFNHSLFAQNGKELITTNQFWFGYNMQAKLNDKWTLLFDTGLRTTKGFSRWRQQLARTGLQYNLSSNITLAAGFTYFNNYPTDGSEGPSRNEFRPWQQIMFSNTQNRFTIRHRIRTEQRFIQNVVNNQTVDSYTMNHRFRYQLHLTVRLNKPQNPAKTFNLILADEIMVNAGKTIVYNHLDQNRIYGGFNYHFNKEVNLQIGYFYIYQQRPSGNIFDNQHVIVTTLYHLLDFSRKQKSPSE